MTISNNWQSWLDEAEVPAAAQAPTSDPTTGATAQPPAPQGADTAGANQPSAEDTPKLPEDDVTQDPGQPDVEQSEDKDFEQWRHDFFELSVKGDTNEMMASIEPMAERDFESSSHEKFVF